MYYWWNLCALYLLACQVRVTVGDSGLCCCVCCDVFRVPVNSLVWRKRCYPYCRYMDLRVRRKRHTKFQLNIFVQQVSGTSVKSLIYGVDTLSHTYRQRFFFIYRITLSFVRLTLRGRLIIQAGCGVATMNVRTLLLV